MNTFLLAQDFLTSFTNLVGAYELPDPGLLSVWGTRLYNIALVVFGLGFVIFVHELGHFLAAKTFGVKCDKFYVGFDVPIKIGPIRLPAKLVHFKWGETEYGIGAIPLGGYVKMLGQDDDPRKAEEEAKRIREQAEADGVELTPTGLDPRSYPAKPVYARMVIISAGVIMNLIFGAIFAAGAFMWGVPGMPSIVGNVIPGDPAWTNGIKPGDQIVSVSNDMKPSKDLRFDDMRQEVAMHGMSTPDVPIPIILERDGKQIELPVKGSMLKTDKSIMTIGIINAFKTVVSDTRAYSPALLYDEKHASGAVTLGPFNLGDKIVAVDGNKLPDYQGQDAPADFELYKKIDPKFSDTIKVTVESPAEKDKPSTTREIDWAPVPRRTIGVQYAVGPVVQVQKDSPAAEAKVGITDRPVAFNGEPITDAATLPLAVAKLAGQSVKLTLKRMDHQKDGELYDFTWQVPSDFSFSRSGGRPIGVQGYELPGSGLVISVLREVSAVESESAAAKDGLQAGDSLRQVKILKPTDENLAKYFEKYFKGSVFEEQPLDAQHNAIYVNDLVQELPIGTQLKIEYDRDKKTSTAIVTVQADKQWMSPDRGLQFTPMSGIYTEENVGSAMVMGVSEVGRQMKNVVRFLYLLVTNKVNPRMLGGPGVIFYAATQEASEGPTRLLLFLTMLSANLAIINFLPIPALDGGHMMFLAVEAIRGRPVDEELQMKLTMGGVLALLCLMAFVIFNDVWNLSQIFA